MNNRDEISMDKWTTDNIPDLTGKVAIVTGANSGLGLETVYQLAKHGCKVIMACRDLHKGEDAREQILVKLPNANALLVLAHVDMAEMSSVHTFANSILANYKERGISILINNAGVVDLPFETTTDDFDITFQTNYLSHFLLTASLYPLLQMHPGARIVGIGSSHHKYGKIDFNDLQAATNADPRARYYNSKLMLLNFCMELDRRIKEAHHEVISVAAHPGFTATNLLTGDTNKSDTICARFQRSVLFPILNKTIGLTPEQGAAAILYAATAPGVTGGKYYGPDGFMELRGPLHETVGCDDVYNRGLAEKLWEKSEEFTRHEFNIFETAPGAELISQDFVTARLSF